MAAEKSKDPAELDAETASIVTQILSDILEVSFSQPQPSTSNRPLRNSVSNDCARATIPSVQQGDGTNVNPTASEKTDIEHKKSCEVIPKDAPYQTCTVKEILTEILDCTVIRRPSYQLPSTSAQSERNLPDASSPPPECMLEPRLVPLQNYSTRSDSNDSTCSRIQCTVKEVLSEVLDYTVFKKTSRQMSVYDVSMPSTSRTRSEHRERAEIIRSYEVYRALGAGVVNSANAIHDEAYIQRSSVSSVHKILPTYSTVLRMGPIPKIRPICSSCSFIPRKPPPSYAEVEGIWEDSPSLISSESAVFGPDPTYMICPRCRTAVITDVQVHRSVVTHLVALLLCLCLCWPCCLMPYCLRSCNYSHHTCPHCSYYFGMYRPF